MEVKNQLYIGAVTKFDENQTTVTANILHFDVANENAWMPKTGCLDAFFAKLAKTKKYVPAFYNHNMDGQAIGLWKNLEVAGNVLVGTLYLTDTPFVNDVIIPQLKDGTIQGASPTICPIQDSYDRDNNIWEIIEGFMLEASLVPLPADFKADILEVRASMEAKNKSDFEFELLTL